MMRAALIFFIWLAIPAYAADPTPTSTDHPQSNTALQELDRKSHPADARAIGAPPVRTVPGSGSGNMDMNQGSSMGLGVTIPIGKPREAVPKFKPETKPEDNE